MKPSTTSYYRATATAYPAWEPLPGGVRAPVAVIGAGFAGLNTALGLAERGVRDVVLLEREQVGFGASGRNGGFVFAGYSLGEQSLLDQSDHPRARALFKLTTKAVGRIRRRVADYAIPCDVVDEGVIWANWFRDPAVLRQRQQLLADHYGVNWQWLPEAELRGLVRSEHYHDGLYERDALHLHPLNYAIGLAAAAAGQGVRIHERSGVRSLAREGLQWRLRTAQGELLADQVVLACGGYLAGLRKPIDRAILPIATYVMVTEPLGARWTNACAFSRRSTTAASRRLLPRAAGYATTVGRAHLGAQPLAARRAAPADEGPAAGVPATARRARRLRLVGPDELRAASDAADRWQRRRALVGAGLSRHGLAPTCAAGELLAAAIADGDDGWKQFADYGPGNTHRPFGYPAAQASYWWQQSRDCLKTRLEG
ncbi:NAD(P)/FAD-dependent oxidoreductase [Rhodanobacter lindaniclasticus]